LSKTLNKIETPATRRVAMRYVADPAAPSPSSPSLTAGSSHWVATLDLGFERDGDTTRLIRREHTGPLRVQKPLYPEHPSTCHAIIIHPPGGIVGGDELHMQVDTGPKARAFLSTPGAAKWYRANGHRSRQRLRIRVADGAALEWLPQETILFNAADVVFDTTIDLGADASYLGCEILCFGRKASGETFEQGHVQQSMMIRREGKPLWLEQGALAAGSRQMQSPLGLGGYSVCASLIAVGGASSAALLTAVREQCAASNDSHGQFGVTHMKSVIIVRYLGNNSEVARRVMLAAWQVLRPALLGRDAFIPRIWNT
jgi:urease accessory protein